MTHPNARLSDGTAGAAGARGALRLTFLWQFTLVTIVVSILAAAALAYAIEKEHRAATETTTVQAVLDRIRAELKVPLEGLAPYSPITGARLAALEHAREDAALFPYVTAMRIYAHTGEPIYPENSAPDRDNVIKALVADSFFRVDHGELSTRYFAYYTSSDESYVLAVDFSQRQLGAAYASERREVWAIIGVVVTIIATSLLTLAVGASRELEVRRRQAQSTFVGALRVLAEVIDLRDPYTAGHSLRVAQYSRQLAIAVALTPAQVDATESGALLHDIGKIAVPDAVLFKPSKLDAAERQIIQSHPIVGARLLGHIASMEDVVPCVLHHHEHIDGSGYPDGLRGDAIPYGAQVIAVADAFDAMTTDRPYRRAMTAEAAVRELARVAGTQLDEHLVYVFSQLVVRGEIVPPTPRADDVAAYDAKYSIQTRGNSGPVDSTNAEQRQAAIP